MRQGLLKGLGLGVIFVITVILFSNMMNKNLSAELVPMAEPSLPMLYVSVDDMLINPMYGNKQPLEPARIRNSITPLTTREEMTLAIDDYGKDIKSVSYQVIRPGDGKIVENSKLPSLTKEDSLKKVTFTLENRILMNQEYLLVFMVDCGLKEPVYYYTRIVQRAGLNTSKYLEFVRDFYEKCLSKGTASGLTKYIEPDEMVANQSYSKVNIHSSFDQLTWGSMYPELTRKAAPTIREINETTCTIMQDYELAAKDGDGMTEHYQVDEYYRMRYSQSRVMLLDFTRDAEQVFDTDLPVETSQGINLGIANPDLHYMVGDDGDRVAFVQCGDLWTYERTSNKVSHVFGFRDRKGSDAPDIRMNHQDHQIKIIRVTREGDVDFVVSGYMNEGPHEGYTGLAVYHYYGERNVTEEKLFVPCRESDEFLAREINKLAYITKTGQLYFLMQNSLYKIDLAKASWEILLEDIKEDCFSVSDSYKTLAWMDQMSDTGSDKVYILDLESGKKTELAAGRGEKAKVWGFLNEDLLCGYAKIDDIKINEAGETVFAMHDLKILDSDGEPINEYKHKDIWITKVELKEGLAELTLSAWNGSAYVVSGSDKILNNLQKHEDEVKISLKLDGRKGSLVSLQFKKKTATSKILVVSSEYAETKAQNTMKVEIPQTNQKLYMVYGHGKLIETVDHPGEAIRLADAAMGIVLNADQQYVWERGNKKDKQKLNVDDIPMEVLQAPLDTAKLSIALGGEKQVMNLAGCSLDTVLYQVSQGRPVIVRTSLAGDSVAIVGYDAYNTILYNKETKETYYMGIKDSTKLFQEAGNYFISYMEPMEAK